MADLMPLFREANRRYLNDALFHAKVEAVNRVLGASELLIGHTVMGTVLLLDEVEEMARQGEKYAPPSWLPYASPYDEGHLQALLLIKERAPQAWEAFFRG